MRHTIEIAGPIYPITVNASLSLSGMTCNEFIDMMTLIILIINDYC